MTFLQAEHELNRLCCFAVVLVVVVIVLAVRVEAVAKPSLRLL